MSRRLPPARRAGPVLGSLLLGTLLLLSPLVVSPLAGPAAADDDEGKDLVLQVYDVGALTAGHSQFIGEVPPPTSPDELIDSEVPLFGAETEEARYPIGMVDELIELTTTAVEPAYWDTVNASVMSLGEHRFVVRASPAVHSKVAEFLAKMERRVLQTATVEIRAVKADPHVPVSSIDPRKAAGGPSLSLTGFFDQRIAAFRGSRYAYLQGYRVDVAQSATASDPTIGVANLGLAVDARILPVGTARRLTVDLDIRLAGMPKARKVGAGADRKADRTVDAPTFAVVRSRTITEVRAGAWTRVGGSAGDDGWLFFARVTPHEAALPSATPAPIRLRGGEAGENRLEMIDVRDLDKAVPSVWRGVPEPMPSRIILPEPCELPEPAGPLPADALVELFRYAADDSVWDDPASLEVRNGWLLARNRPAVLEQMKDALQVLRRQFLWSITTRAEVFELDAPMLAQLRSGPRVLTAEQVHALRAKARRTHVLELEGRGAARNEIRSGRHVAYVRDYAIKIAQDAEVSSPVMGRLFSGLRLAATPYLASGGKHVVLDVRFRQSNQPPEMRRADTPAGWVELPDMALFRVRSGFVVPLGGSVLLGAHGEGNEHVAVLLTPTLRTSR